MNRCYIGNCSSETFYICRCMQPNFFVCKDHIEFHTANPSKKIHKYSQIVQSDAQMVLVELKKSLSELTKKIIAESRL